MKKSLQFARFCVLPTLLFLGVACKGAVKGYVYLDENANNIKEDDESKIANLTVTLTKDDEDIASAQTDAEGNFEIPSDGSGTYCVSVSQASLSTTNDDGTSPSIAALVRSTAEPVAATESDLLVSHALFATTTTETDCSDGVDDDSDGDIDCNDSDCASDSACIESDCSDGEDNDSDGDTDCDDSDCTSDSACTDSSSTDSTTSSASVESGQACDDSTGGNLTLKVPIARDYSSGIDAIEDPGTSTVSRGDTVSLSIQYPVSCEFSTSLYLSSSLTPMNVPDASYDSTTGQLNLNTAIASAADADLSISDPLSVGDDGIGTFTLELCIGEYNGTTCTSDGGLDSKEVTVSPSVFCPDDSTVSLKTHTISIDSADDIEVTQSMSGTQDYGETITVTTTVTNHTAVSYTSDEVELVLSTPDYTTSQDYDSSCSNLGQTANCTFELPADSSVIFTTSFVLPTTLQANTSFTMSADLTLTSNGDSSTFNGDEVTFSLVCNDCST